MSKSTGTQGTQLIGLGSSLQTIDSYSTKEPGSSITFIHVDTRGSIVWRCAHSKVLRNVSKYPSIEILF